MRILPVIQKYNDSINMTKNSQNIKKSNLNVNTSSAHKYTGVASVDLAYVSMFDNAIAKDLKLMGLI